jgi:LysR substrate binding domain
MTFLEDDLSMITGAYDDLLSLDEVIDKELILFVSLNTNKNSKAVTALGRMLLQNTSDHPLATLKAISPRDLVGETFVIVSNTAPVLRAVIDNYLKRLPIDIKPAHEADNVTMGISLILSTRILSTRGVGLLPAYTQNFFPSSVTSRPLKGATPTVELVLGYRKSNQSPILKLLLSKLDELIGRASNHIR